MNVAIALTAVLYGATVVNHAEVNELVKDPVSGKITGVRIKDLLDEKDGEPFFVKTKASPFILTFHGPQLTIIRV